MKQLFFVGALTFSTVFLAACAGGPATNLAAHRAAADPCHVAQWSAPDLYGTWQVEFPQWHQTGTLLLRQHPEYKGSLRGELNYGGQASIASGDIEQGQLDLDESRDRKNLYAMWTGNLVPSTCGKEIRGTWQKVVPEGDPAVQTPFVLRRAGGAAGAWGGGSAASAQSATSR
jgi:hypothetical protein